MKEHTRRLLSLLLALLMVLTLVPAASMEGEENDDGEEEAPVRVTEFSLIDELGQLDGMGDSYTLILEPDTSSAGGLRIGTHLEPDNVQAIRMMHVVWNSDNSAVVSVNEQPADAQYGEGHVANIVGKAPGTATITATADKLTCTIAVEVSGIKLSDELVAGLSLKENETRTLIEGKDYFLFGRAATTDEKISAAEVNNKPIVFIPDPTTKSSVTIEGRQEGTGMVRLRLPSGGRVYEAEFPITVTSNEARLEWTAGVSTEQPLKFSNLESVIAQKCQEMTGSPLASIVGLSVPTAQGIIYLGYKSPEDTGAGAGSSIVYYAASGSRGPYIKDLTYVPNPSFGGEKATITFTGTAANGRTFKGRVEVTLTDSAADPNVTLTTRSDVPLKLKAEDFLNVCQQQTGSALSYVIFTLPPASEGVLYRDYKNALDYASRVTASEQYDRKGLNTLTFVPAEGFVGTVTVNYAGYSVTGTRYNGELIIKVTRSLDDGIQYQDYGSGEITFAGSDFDAYCTDMTGYRMNTVSFTPPAESQGTLYYRWSANSQRYPVASGNSFNLNQLGYVTFVAANGFDGVVRIPFTGTNWYGAEFSGTVELHIQAGDIQNGDIRYSCQPGQSVKLVVSDFASLCQAVTGQRLYYVTFQALPDYTQGALFYNRTSSGVIGTRVTTASKYFNSATPYLNNVSFWAADQFRSVEIPFTLAGVNGATFTGLMVISSGEGAGSGQASDVTYLTSGQQPVTLNSADFDAVCRKATNSALNYLKLSLPGSGQGILYYDYREGDTPKAFDTNQILYCTGGTSINKVTFVPAKGFSGTAYMPFTATAINGNTYQGTLAITVRSGAAYGSIVRYSTGGAPVHLQSSDVAAASGIGQLTGVRFTGLPSSSQGQIYYQYISPTQYSWLGNTTSIYSVSGDPSVSNLTFIPRAGYQGVVNIPYIATAYDGTTAAGTIEITVAQPDNSVYFDDLSGYSAATKAAVDYMASQGVVNGISYRTYAPGQSIRRGDFCLMVSRAFQFKVSGTGIGFDDVPAGYYYTQAIQEMYALGVINGVGGGKFLPESTITRQDAAVMVCRALEKAGLPLPDGSDQAALAGYTDRNKVDSYAQAALGSLVRAGYFPAAGDKLDPKTPITRADMALLLHRAMTNFS